MKELPMRRTTKGAALALVIAATGACAHAPEVLPVQLSRRDITAAMETLRPQIEFCYRGSLEAAWGAPLGGLPASLNTVPNPSSILASFTILPDGRLDDITVNAGELCVMDAFRTALFPRFTGLPMHVNYSLALVH
jgi:hypothetical protein